MAAVGLAWFGQLIVVVVLPELEVTTLPVFVLCMWVCLLTLRWIQVQVSVNDCVRGLGQWP